MSHLSTVRVLKQFVKAAWSPSTVIDISWIMNFQTVDVGVGGVRIVGFSQ